MLGFNKFLTYLLLICGFISAGMYFFDYKDDVIFKFTLLAQLFLTGLLLASLGWEEYRQDEE